MSVTAPEAPTAGDPVTETPKMPHTERRQQEVTSLGRSILRSKLHESGALNKEPDARNSHENKLVLLEFLQTGKHPDNGLTVAENLQLNFDKWIKDGGKEEDFSGIPCEGGNPLLMGEMDFKLDDTEVHFANQQVALAGIAGVTEEGNYIGYFVDSKTGNPIMVDKGDGSQIRFEAPVLPEMVVDAQILAEADAYRQDMTPAQSKAYDVYLASRPQNESTDAPYELPADIADTLIEAAKDSNILTVADVRSFCNARLENTDPAAEEKFLKPFEGKVLLEPADMLKALEADGFSSKDLQDKSDALQAEIAELRSRMEGASEDVQEALQNEMDAKGLESKLYKELSNLMATDAGKQHIETQMAAAFANTDAAKPLLEAFRNGNIEGMLDSLGDVFPEGMSDEAKEKVTSQVLKQVGEKGLMGLGVLGIIALIVGGIAIASAQMAASAGRQ